MVKNYINQNLGNPVNNGINADRKRGLVLRLSICFLKRCGKLAKPLALIKKEI